MPHCFGQLWHFSLEYWLQLCCFFLRYQNTSSDRMMVQLKGDIQGLINSQGTLGFGRLRMIHTTFAVFAFVGNSFFTGAYYSMQRLLKTRMYSDVLSWIVFWGWQLFIVLSFVTFILGYNTSKEYAEHEWPIDILIALVWVLFGAQMFFNNC